LEISERFTPDVVISDFDSFAYLYGVNWMLPVISIDNMQVINRCRHEAAITAGFQSDFQIARNIVKGKLPGCYHYLVSTFFYPPLRKERTTLVPPVLRPEILEARPERGEHLLVYQTSTSNRGLPRILEASGLPCVVYGVRRDIREDVTEANLTYRPFSERGFIDDLRTARAVVAGGGFTLMSECVYLHKPMLSVPVIGQIEQVINSRYLERVGYGRTSDHVDAEVLRAFLSDLPRLQANLETYHQDGNTVALSTLDALLDRAAAGL
jgi:uncharacterized protein (TIGR00661 family)